MNEITELLDIEFSDEGGWPQLRCQLDPADRDALAALLARGITQRRVGVNERLHNQWQARHLDLTHEPLAPRDRLVLEASLLQNIGTPDEPAPDDHLRGLVAEAIWFAVVADIDAGLGHPIRVEGHDWSATDPGGDGLTVYLTASNGYCFRLWESKFHGALAPVRHTVNGACRQMKSRSPSYLARFSLIAQHITDNDDLASFYAALTELWVDRDPAAGVGISVGANTDADADQCFGNVTTYFDLEPAQHQAHLHLLGDFNELAQSVRAAIWKGCGPWTERSTSSS